MKKLFFFINTISNLSIKQIYFLANNKLIKKILYKIKLQKLPSDINNDLQLSFTQIKNDIKIFSPPLVEVNNSNEHNKYYVDLKKNIIEFEKTNNFDKIQQFWSQKSDDIELNYNYQRFYLFKEVFNEINYPQQKQIEILIKWIEKNENNKLGWTGFNCAIRIINWLKILNDIEIQNINEAYWKIIENSIYRQTIFNIRNIEHHIPGNHVLFQYYSIWLITQIFSNWFNVKEKNEFSEKLFDEIVKEFLNDGLHFELSTHYHLQITLLGLKLIDHLKKINSDIPNDINDVIVKAYKVLNKFLIGNYLPLIGDGCYNFFNENRYLDIENCKFYANENFNNNVIHETKNVVDENFIIEEFNNFKVIFDIGNIGLKQNAGHGHADILNIIVGYEDIPIFIDPGTFQYNNKEESLELKRTKNHNTLSIQNNDQAILWGFFRWAYLPSKIKYKVSELSHDNKILYGEFYGYHNLGGVTHSRSLNISTNKITITDTLKSNVTENVYVNFILHPCNKVELIDNIVTIITSKNELQLINKNEKIIPTIENIDIFDSYNEPISAKKIVFKYSQVNFSDFNSEIDLRVIK